MHAFRLAARFALAALALSAHAAGAPQIDLDGDLSDWPEGVHAFADARSMYFRLDVPEPVVLQTAPWTVMLALDLDNNPDTGRRFEFSDAAIGADAVVKMPPPWSGARGNDPAGVGAAVYSGRSRREVGAYAVDLHWAPTHAATSFEFRIRRRSGAEGRIPLLEQERGVVSGRFLAVDGEGATVWESPRFSFELPARDPEPWRTDAVLPPKPEGAIRVLSYNVLWATPMVSPEPFDRIFHAIDPDVVLLQEWDVRDFDAPHITTEELVKWFDFSMADRGPWRAVRGEERGVVIVSRFPAERLPVGSVFPVADGDDRVRTDRSVRFIGARIETPLGDMIAASYHLKCCGGLDGEEDAQRAAEARAINRAIRDEIRRQPASMIAIAGDSNLVGSFRPLAILREKADIDASDLLVADLRTLGDPTRITWRDPNARFPPGRLDYALVGDAHAEIVNAFILDPAFLTDEELERIGVQRTDTDYSDHLPLVIDIRPRAKGDRGGR